jgi:hypothetical protein
MLKPTGFRSYATTDDTSSRGRLGQLRRLLADELQQRIGREPKGPNLPGRGGDPLWRELGEGNQPGARPILNSTVIRAADSLDYKTRGIPIGPVPVHGTLLF